MKLSAAGFTLIELLVVMAIMGIIGVYSLANYRSFGEDQNLRNAVLDIITLLRQAQTNATAGTICTNAGGAMWRVNFKTTNTLELQCKQPSQTSFTTKKILVLDRNITIASGIISEGCGGQSISLPFPVYFAPVTGKIILADTACSLFNIPVTNNKTTKFFTIETGGRIYAQ
ncbi:prepilin-type N-terminal cleavage/methylation domain-containing protein [Candidatus Daviesbacteria bacterium]|nr:prepilin-type N-terminal cleavage/methylation domain-containing protein [Candidatus Daviesbacteria bacterium]